MNKFVWGRDKESIAEKNFPDLFEGCLLQIVSRNIAGYLQVTCFLEVMGQFPIHILVFLAISLDFLTKKMFQWQNNQWTDRQIVQETDG